MVDCLTKGFGGLKVCVYMQYVYKFRKDKQISKSWSVFKSFMYSSV